MPRMLHLFTVAMRQMWRGWSIKLTLSWQYSILINGRHAFYIRTTAHARVSVCVCARAFGWVDGLVAAHSAMTDQRCNFTPDDEKPNELYTVGDLESAIQLKAIEMSLYIAAYWFVAMTPHGAKLVTSSASESSIYTASASRHRASKGGVRHVTSTCSSRIKSASLSSNSIATISAFQHARWRQTRRDLDMDAK